MKLRLIRLLEDRIIPTTELSLRCRRRTYLHSWISRSPRRPLIVLIVEKNLYSMSITARTLRHFLNIQVSLNGHRVHLLHRHESSNDEPRRVAASCRTQSSEPHSSVHFTAECKARVDYRRQISLPIRRLAIPVHPFVRQCTRAEVQPGIWKTRIRSIRKRTKLFQGTRHACCRCRYLSGVSWLPVNMSQCCW